MFSIHSYVRIGEFLVVGSNGEVNIYRRPIGSDGFQDFNHPYRSDEDGNFGHAVAVDEDGNFAVGAPGERSGQGSIHVYKRVGKSSWTEIKPFEQPDVSSDADFGWSVAIDRNFLVVGAPGEGNSGSVFVYKEQTTDSWVFSEQLTPKDGEKGDKFGWSVAMDNNNLIVGSPFAAISENVVSFCVTKLLW